MTRTSSCSWSFSVILLMTLPVCWPSALSVSDSCIVMIGTGGDMNRTILLYMEKIPLMNLSISDVSRSTATAEFLTIPNMTLMQPSTIWTCNTIVLTTSTLWLVALFRLELSQGLIYSAQSSSIRSSRSRLRLAPKSKTQLIGRIRNAFKPKLMATFYF